MTVEAPNPATVAELPETLRHVPTMLGAEFGSVNADVVQRTVSDTYRELASDARISSFLPILTEKVARDRLAGIAGPRRQSLARSLTA